MRAGQLFGARPRRVFCDVGAYVSCRGYVGIPLRAQVHPCECKVAPRIVSFFRILFVLDRYFSSVRDVFYFAFYPRMLRAKAQAHRAAAFGSTRR